MLDLRHASMPDYFVPYLRVNMAPSTKAFSHLKVQLLKHPGLKLAIQPLLESSDNRLSTDQLLKSIGWQTLRNKIVENFFYRTHLVSPRSSEETKAQMDSVLAVEAALMPFSTHGHSRAFLLGLYFEMLRLEYPEFAQKVFFDPEIVDILRLAKTKIAPIDWMFIFLCYLKFFIGTEELKSEIRKGTDYRRICQKISLTQQTLLVENLLSYASSIDEEDFFVVGIV